MIWGILAFIGILLDVIISIYAHIENSDQGRTSLPIHSNENTISEIKKYISGLRGDEKGFKYICNGNNRCHISELRNRLLQ